MSHSEKARALFLEGYNCSQAVLCAFDDVTGLDRETSAKLASSFGGGMGRMREVCGCVSGALMVLGLVKGYAVPEAVGGNTETQNASLPPKNGSPVADGEAAEIHRFSENISFPETVLDQAFAKQKACPSEARISGRNSLFHPESHTMKKNHYALVREFADRFREQNGSIICRELLAGVAVTPGGEPEARTEEYYKKRPCPDLVACAAEILDEFI